jgi:hypothetical protein
MDYNIIEEKKDLYDYANLNDKGIELWPHILIKIPKESENRIKGAVVNGYTFKYFLAFGTCWIIYSPSEKDGKYAHEIGNDTNEWLEFSNLITNTDLENDRVEIKIGNNGEYTYGLAIRYETLKRIFEIKARDVSTHPNAVIGYRFKTYDKVLPTYYKIYKLLEKNRKNHNK